MINNIITCIILMIFMHIVDDYYLQGILASMKQKKWWSKNAPDDKRYKYDYVWALIMHAFSWSFMVILPPLYLFNLSFSKLEILVIFLSNIVIHGVTDHIKANLLKINLIQDQLIHIAQIILTAIICCYIL